MKAFEICIRITKNFDIGNLERVIKTLDQLAPEIEKEVAFPSLPTPSVAAPLPSTPATSALAVKIDEAAQMLGVSTRTLRREIDRGSLRALRLGRVWRVRVSEINAYLQRMEVKATR